MAKLSAHGRKELYRMVVERETPDSALFSWERRTRVLMSDGKVLEKCDCRFRDSVYGDHKYSYGWRVAAKLKEGCTPIRWAANCVLHGWKKV
jgi:hypothetical protein